MGIKQNSLYRVLPGLAKDKQVVKRGKSWRVGVGDRHKCGSSHHVCRPVHD